MSIDRTELLVRYLTGRLEPDEALRLEERYLENDALYEELLAVETELIDSYEQGELTAEEAAHLRSQFTAAQLHARVRLARVLRQEMEAGLFLGCLLMAGALHVTPLRRWALRGCPVDLGEACIHRRRR
jgi:hypothetical protein